MLAGRLSLRYAWPRLLLPTAAHSVQGHFVTSPGRRRRARSALAPQEAAQRATPPQHSGATASDHTSASPAAHARVGRLSERGCGAARRCVEHSVINTKLGAALVLRTLWSCYTPGVPVCILKRFSDRHKLRSLALAAAAAFITASSQVLGAPLGRRWQSMVPHNSQNPRASSYARRRTPREGRPLTPTRCERAVAEVTGYHCVRAVSAAARRGALHPDFDAAKTRRGPSAARAGGAPERARGRGATAKRSGGTLGMRERGARGGEGLGTAWPRASQEVGEVWQSVRGRRRDPARWGFVGGAFRARGGSVQRAARH